MKQMTGLFLIALLAMAGVAQAELADKTLVAWAAPANLTQHGGSVLTMDDGQGHFDGIVFAEKTAAKWMAGSEMFHRTQPQQDTWPVETTDASTLVQIAIAYHGKEIITFRNGAEYSRYTTANEPPTFDADALVLIGLRHLGNGDFFAGTIADARIYDRALTGAELAALKPNEEGTTKPWAWWSFARSAAKELTGRFTTTRLVAGAKVENGRLVLDGKGATLFASANAASLARALNENPEMDVKTWLSATPPADMVLNFHLMHPGGDTAPDDPNAAFCLDGIYHLHYILSHPWKNGRGYSFVHVTSPDMLHWTWQPTTLQPSFTGHGMFSGTGFITKEGKPAAIYHGAGSGHNQIAIAKDNQLSAWEKPYPIEVKNTDGSPAKINYWDPDCFLIGDTYYAYSGGKNPPLMKSNDLKNWTLVGDFMRNDLPESPLGEDVSCGNFFKLGDKWMLLCISHPLGCRYYLGDWDAQAEQFVPEKFGRMVWQVQSTNLQQNAHGYFAPESVLTPDGRRVIWAWLLNSGLGKYAIQGLPREISLPADGMLRIKPLRELESLRYDAIELSDIKTGAKIPGQWHGAFTFKHIADLPGEAAELRITVARAEADRKRFGIYLFGDGKGGGLPIVICPEKRTIRVGEVEAPFAVADLPAGEDVVLRVFVDKYLVDVFVNDRQAVVATQLDWHGKTGIDAYTWGWPTTIKKLEMWKLKPTNQGFLDAETNRVWMPQTK